MAASMASERTPRHCSLSGSTSHLTPSMCTFRTDASAAPSALIRPNIREVICAAALATIQPVGPCRPVALSRSCSSCVPIEPSDQVSAARLVSTVKGTAPSPASDSTSACWATRS